MGAADEAVDLAEEGTISARTADQRLSNVRPYCASSLLMDIMKSLAWMPIVDGSNKSRSLVL